MPAVDISGQVHAALQSVVDEVNRIGVDLAALRTVVNQAVADVASLYTRLDTHVHGGVTAGGANTSAIAAIGAKTSAAAGALTAKGLSRGGPQ